MVGIPDALKGQLPFAFVTTSSTLSTSTTSTTSTNPSEQQQQQLQGKEEQQLFKELQTLVRTQVGPIASLGGIITGRGMIPKTRSGKTLRRVLRELLENAVHGEFDKQVSVPSTVEDAAVVDVARERVRAYFVDQGGRGRHGAVEGRSSKL